MRICLHKFAALFLVFGLVTGSMSQASVIQMKNGPMQSAGVSGKADIPLSPGDVGKSCGSMGDMVNCTMKHPPRVSVVMGCCGCFLGAATSLCLDPRVNRISGFGTSDVTGDSRAPISLLRPPRA
jgi:hypothetical protein